MKFIHWFLVLFALLPVPMNAQEDWSPQYPVLSRYRETWENSPFTRITSSSASGNFAKDLVIAGLSRIGDDWTVLVLNKQTRKYTSLSSAGSSVDGMRVVEVLPHSDRRQAKVILSNGKQQASIGYETRQDSEPTPAESQPSPRTTPEEPVKLPLQLPETAPEKAP